MEVHLLVAFVLSAGFLPGTVITANRCTPTGIAQSPSIVVAESNAVAAVQLSGGSTRLPSQLRTLVITWNETKVSHLLSEPHLPEVCDHRRTRLAAGEEVLEFVDCEVKIH